MSLASLHDIRGREIQLRMDKRVVAAFPYSDSAERLSQLNNATAYVKKAIKGGADIKLKPGVEEHAK